MWNAGSTTWKPFLDLTELEWEESIADNVLGPAAFARECITIFKDLEFVLPNGVSCDFSTNQHLGCSLTPEGSRGTLLFTGATSSVRGNKLIAAFSAGKFALRSLSRSLAKEFGKQNIHVAHAVIEGWILTERTVKIKGEEWAKDEDIRMNPEGIAQVGLFVLVNDRFGSFLVGVCVPRSSTKVYLDLGVRS